MTDAPSGDIKSRAHRLIDALPDDATWDDVMYHVYVRRCIDAGVEDADAGRVIDVNEVRRRFGLTT
jgi:predicted transcriptional regulator